MYRQEVDLAAAGGAGGDPGAAPDECVALGAGGQGDHHAFPCLPHVVDGVLGPVPPKAFVDPVGQPQQGQLAQRGEVADAEIAPHRGVDLLGRVDVAVGQAAAQRLGGHVDQLDLVGPAYYSVGDGLPWRDAGDLFDHIAEAFQVLHIHRGEHADAGVHHLFDVLPPLRVAATESVGVSELVDDDDLRASGEERGDVEFGKGVPVVAHLSSGLNLQPCKLLGRVGAAVGLHQSDDHVGSPGEPAVRLAEGGVGLSDARRGAEVDAQDPAGHGAHDRPDPRPTDRQVGRHRRHPRGTRPATCSGRNGPVPRRTDGAATQPGRRGGQFVRQTGRSGPLRTAQGRPRRPASCGFTGPPGPGPASLAGSYPVTHATRRGPGQATDQGLSHVRGSDGADGPVPDGATAPAASCRGGRP